MAMAGHREPASVGRKQNYAYFRIHDGRVLLFKRVLDESNLADSKDHTHFHYMRDEFNVKWKTPRGIHLTMSDGITYMGQKVDESDLFDCRDYDNFYYIRASNGDKYKVPYGTSGVPKEYRKYQRKVRSRYWKQEYECYQDATGHTWYRSMGYPVHSPPSDLGSVAEERRQYLDFVQQLSLADNQHEPQRDERGGAAMELEIATLPGGSPQSGGPKASGVQYMRLGTIKGAVGPNGAESMDVFGRVNSKGQVFDLYLRPKERDQEDFRQLQLPQATEAAAAEDHEGVVGAEGGKEDDEDGKIDDAAVKEHVLKALKESVVVGADGVDMVLEDDEEVRDVGVSARHFMKSLKKDEGEDMAASLKSVADGPRKEEAPDRYLNDAGDQPFHKEFLAVVDNRKGTPNGSDSDSEGEVKLNSSERVDTKFTVDAAVEHGPGDDGDAPTGAEMFESITKQVRQRFDSDKDMETSDHELDEKVKIDTGGSKELGSSGLMKLSGGSSLTGKAEKLKGDSLRERLDSDVEKQESQQINSDELGNDCKSKTDVGETEQGVAAASDGLEAAARNCLKVADQKEVTRSTEDLRTAVEDALRSDSVHDKLQRSEKSGAKEEDDEESDGEISPDDVDDDDDIPIVKEDSIERGSLQQSSPKEKSREEEEGSEDPDTDTPDTSGRDAALKSAGHQSGKYSGKLTEDPKKTDGDSDGEILPDKEDAEDEARKAESPGSRHSLGEDETEETADAGRRLPGKDEEQDVESDGEILPDEQDAEDIITKTTSTNGHDGDRKQANSPNEGPGEVKSREHRGKLAEDPMKGDEDSDGEILPDKENAEDEALETGDPESRHSLGGDQSELTVDAPRRLPTKDQEQDMELDGDILPDEQDAEDVISKTTPTEAPEDGTAKMTDETKRRGSQDGSKEKLPERDADSGVETPADDTVPVETSTTDLTLNPGTSGNGAAVEQTRELSGGQAVRGQDEEEEDASDGEIQPDVSDEEEEVMMKNPLLDLIKGHEGKTTDEATLSEPLEQTTQKPEEGEKGDAVAPDEGEGEEDKAQGTTAGRDETEDEKKLKQLGVLEELKLRTSGNKLSHGHAEEEEASDGEISPNDLGDEEEEAEGAGETARDVEDSIQSRTSSPDEKLRSQDDSHHEADEQTAAEVMRMLTSTVNMAEMCQSCFTTRAEFRILDCSHGLCEQCSEERKFCPTCDELVSAIERI